MLLELPTTTLDRFGISRAEAIRLSGSHILMFNQTGLLKGGGYVTSASGETDHRMTVDLVGFWVVDDVPATVACTKMVDKVVHDGVKATLSRVLECCERQVSEIRTERDRAQGAFQGLLEHAKPKVSVEIPPGAG